MPLHPDVDRAFLEAALDASPGLVRVYCATGTYGDLVTDLSDALAAAFRLAGCDARLAPPRPVPPDGRRDHVPGHPIT